MGFSKKEIENIYHKCNGYCNICDKKMYLTNYGKPGERGAWEVDHSNPIACGGTDNKNNLQPTHITCNRSKGTKSTKTARNQAKKK